MPSDFIRYNGYHQPEPWPRSLGKPGYSPGAFSRGSFSQTNLELVYEERRGNAKLAQPQLGKTDSQTAVPRENILIWESRRNSCGLFGAGLGVQPGQCQGYGGSSWGRTGTAGPGAPPGHGVWPVGLGIPQEPVWLIQAVTQREAVWGLCLTLAFSLAEVNYSTLCTPAPPGTCHPAREQAH